MNNSFIKGKTAHLNVIAFMLVMNILLFVIPRLSFASNGTSSGAEGNKIAAHVFELKQQNVFSREFNLFTVADVESNKVLQSGNKVQQAVSKSTMLNINGNVSEIMNAKPDYLKMSIPIENGARNLSVLLYKVNISPNGFTLLTSDGLPQVMNPNIVHYRGSLENDDHSVVCFSFTDNETMGLISNSEGNYVLGKIEDQSGLYIIYNDADMTTKLNFNCGSSALPQNRPPKNNSGNMSVNSAKCVNWYWETDYDLYTNKGSVANVNTYMQALFNQVSTLYANDGITIYLKTLFVWNSADPYPSDASACLTTFVSYRTTFNGDLAHLIGFGNSGIAYVGVLCSYSKDYQKGYSGMSASYNTVPTYSWTVHVLTHEMGHEMGSPHTHACFWNGNNTKIDDCGGSAGASEGTCNPAPNPILPAGGGTIMSYCHLTSAGVNLSKGFGPQPTALILGNINNGSCLTSCGCTTPTQPGTIAGNGTACPLSVQTYSVSPVSGALSYAWVLPSGWSGSSASNSITVTTGSIGGTVSVSASNSCGSSALQSKSVIVGTPAQPSTITGNTSMCPNSSQVYSIAVVSGAISYTWALPSGWSGSSTTNSITATVGTAGGTVSVKANNSSCGSGPAQTLNAIVSNAPSQPGAISGNATACQTSSQIYSVAPVSGASSYRWTLPSGWAGSSTTNSITATAGSAGGTLSVSALNGCGTGIAKTLSLTVSSLPGQPVAITGNTSMCKNTTQAYSVTAVSGATSYTWTLPSGWAGTSTINSISATAGTTSGTVSVNANNGCGSGIARTLAVNVSTIPAVPGSISGSSSVCINSSRVYSVSPVAGATGYTWTLPSGWAGASTNNSITVTSSTSGGTISVKASNGCGIGSSRTLGVSVVATTPLQPGAMTGSVSVCQGAKQTFAVNSVSGATSYTWSLPSGWTGTSTTRTIVPTVNSAGIISVVANNNCGTGPARTLSVNVNGAVPSQPGVITGSSSLCKGSKQTFQIGSVAGAVSYTWKLPSGWSGSSSTNSILATGGTTGGTISVTANNSCGSSTARTFSVTSLNIPAKPVAITGSIQVLALSIQTYLVNPVSGATSYTWSLPSGWSGLSVSNSILATAGNNAGVVSVAAKNTCGVSSAQTLSVNITGGMPESLVTDNLITVFSIYPNPARDFVTVSFSSSMTAPVVEIYNMMGEVIFQERYSNVNDKSTFQIPLRVPAGIYFVRVTDGENQNIQKLIVQ